MADKKISQLTGSTTPLGGSEELPLVQSGVTKKVSVANLTAGRAVSVLSLSAINDVGGSSLTATGSAASNLARATLQNTDPGGKKWVLGDAVGTSNGTFALYNLTDFVPAFRVTSTGDVSVPVGNLVIGTAGKGIDFSADPSAAGMTSELLDDYEEGTWTPTDASGGGLTFTVSRGRYVKIGRQVTCFGLVQYPSNSNANNTAIGSLPFATSNPYGGGFTGAGGFFTYQTNNAVTRIAVAPGAATALLYTDTGALVANSALSGSTFGFSIVYDV